MKYTNTCPKCNNTEIAKIEAGTFKGSMYNAISFGLTTIYVTRFVCVCCGFSEEYVENTSDIEKIRKKFYDPNNSQGFV